MRKLFYMFFLTLNFLSSYATDAMDEDNDSDSSITLYQLLTHIDKQTNKPAVSQTLNYRGDFSGSQANWKIELQVNPNSAVLLDNYYGSLKLSMYPNVSDTFNYIMNDIIKKIGCDVSPVENVNTYMHFIKTITQHFQDGEIIGQNLGLSEEIMKAIMSSKKKESENKIKLSAYFQSNFDQSFQYTFYYELPMDKKRKQNQETDQNKKFGEINLFFKSEKKTTQLAQNIDEDIDAFFSKLQNWFSMEILKDVAQLLNANSNVTKPGMYH